MTKTLHKADINQESISNARELLQEVGKGKLHMYTMDIWCIYRNDTQTVALFKYPNYCVK